MKKRQEQEVQQGLFDNCNTLKEACKKADDLADVALDKNDLNMIKQISYELSILFAK